MDNKLIRNIMNIMTDKQMNKRTDRHRDADSKTKSKKKISKDSRQRDKKATILIAEC